MNVDALTDFKARAGRGGAVVMLNLLRFHPDGGRERYAEYMEAVKSPLEEVGAKVVYWGDPAAALLGEQSWDSVLLVEYPSRKAFLEMVRSTAYREIEHLRAEALQEGELHPMETHLTATG
jgi:uncharacterized protein (DUF1330 family)